MIALTAPIDLTRLTFCSVAPDVIAIALYHFDEQATGIEFQHPQNQTSQGQTLVDGCGTFTAPFAAYPGICGIECPTETFDQFPLSSYVVSLNGGPGIGIFDDALFDLAAAKVEDHGTLGLDVVTGDGLTIHLSAPTDLETLTFCGLGPDAVRLQLSRVDPATRQTVFQVPQYPAVAGGCASFSTPFSTQIQLLLFDSFPLGGYVIATHNDLSGRQDGGIFFLSAEVLGGALRDQVQALVDRGLLTSGRARALFAVLDAATRQMADGKDPSAVAILRTFVVQVEALVRAAALTAQEGQLLADAANAVIDHLSENS